MQFLFGKTHSKSTHVPAEAYLQSKIDLFYYYEFMNKNPGYPYKEALNYITHRRYADAEPCEIDYGYLLNQQMTDLTEVDKKDSVVYKGRELANKNCGFKLPVPPSNDEIEILGIDIHNHKKKESV